MARQFAKAFYASSRWERTRKAYIDSVGGLCEICEEKGHINPGYIVHHLLDLNENNINDPYITTHFDNLQYVCLQCHNDIHNPSRPVLRDDVMFNEYGELVPRMNEYMEDE